MDSDTPHFDKWFKRQFEQPQESLSGCLVATHDAYREKQIECEFWRTEYARERVRAQALEDQWNWVGRNVKRGLWAIAGFAVAIGVSAAIMWIGRHL